MANADRELSDPHVSGTATACNREILSTIGSALHGSTAATASNFAILSSALGINGAPIFDAVVVVVRFATLLAVDDSIVVVVVVVVVVAVLASADAPPFPSAIVVDHRLAFAGEQLACISPVSPHAPISYLRLVDVA